MSRIAHGLLPLLAWLMLSCSGRNVPADRAGTADGIGSMPVTAEVPSDASLFELTFELTDQDGRRAHLADLSGQPFVASMIYTQCKSVCPRITADLQRLDRSLAGPERDGLRFVLFSLDPERDTPEAMRTFAEDHGLDRERWTLFSASEDDMRTLAAVLGVRHRPDGSGEIAHSAIIAVVDGRGVVRHRQTGLQDEIAPLIAAVRTVR